jgi:hypothetical protein
MGRREGHKAEKRPGPVSLDEVDCAIRAHIDDVAGGADHAATVFQRRIDVLSPAVWPKYSSNPRAMG